MSASEKTVTTTPVQYALRYAAMGWKVFPCREGEKRPLTEKGFHSATTDETMIQQLWRDNPRANIGVPTGPAFWVLDIDPRHGGADELAALESEHGELPATLVAKTPSGGLHYFFSALPQSRNSAGKVGPGIDVRGHGGYVCVEGSAVNGSGYAFQDWDPLIDSEPGVAPAPAWLVDRAFGKPAPTKNTDGNPSNTAVIEGGRNSYLTSQAGRLRKMGLSGGELEAALQRMNVERCKPALDAAEVSQIANSVARYEPAPPPPEEESAPAPRRNMVQWAALANHSPPEFSWILDHWLSWHPTLLYGRGGVGKSLLAQQIATGLAVGRPLWGSGTGPVKVLYWACEDDLDEIWRREDRICRSLRIGFDRLDNLNIDARSGMDNAVFTTEFGKAMWTPLYGELIAQVNDYQADVLIVDNIAQVFGGNENDRHHVTAFLNGIVGVVRNRPFCPIILGHIAKSPTSEYSGSTAWENAARMRWYLGDKLPDQEGNEDQEPTQDRRFLCKRKTNYSAQDYVEFDFQNGLLVASQQAAPGEDDGGGTVAHLRNRRAKTVVLQAVNRLAKMGIYGSDGKGANYLPTKISEMNLAEGMTKFELRNGMNALLLEGALTREKVGEYANRTARFGLVDAAQNLHKA